MSERVPRRERRKWSKAEKREILSRQPGSGKSIVEYCRELGLSDSYFHRWKRALRAASSNFVEVDATGMASRPVAVPVRLVLSGGDSIDTSSDCDPEWLARTVRALRTTSC